MAMCLHGVFPPESSDIASSITFLDNYLAHPHSKGDFAQTLRYCTIMVQLTDCFEQLKCRFVMLRYPFAFHLNLPKGHFLTTSHQAEVLVRVSSLAIILSDTLMARLHIEDETKQLVVMSDLAEMNDDELKVEFGRVRKVIGLLQYCIYSIFPRAINTIRKLESLAPLLLRDLRSYYNTLRATGCWLAAVIKLRRADNTKLAAAGANGQRQSLDDGMKHLQECIMIVNGTSERSSHHNANVVIVTRFMSIIRSSCVYETDLRCSRNVLLKMDVRHAFFKRAEALSIAKMKIATCVWDEPAADVRWMLSTPCNDVILETYRSSVAGGGDPPSIDAMKKGDNPLIESIFKERS